MAKKAKEKTEAEIDAEIAALEAEAEVAEPVKYDVIKLEDGGEAHVYPDQKKLFRVQGFGGKYYDHVSDDPETGEWVYRHC